MSVSTPIRQITVTANGAFRANVFILTSSGNTIFLSPRVGDGDEDTVFDLARVQGLLNGETIQVGISSNTGRQSIDPTRLTYNKNSTNQALYATTGSADGPAIILAAIAPIRN
ncbi:hypothetical protein C8J56DRAFT_1160426 [Mycena floridula]|nr:hypothetical protein C8J56DRAFT_1160426 [Mycena floridula]